MTQPYLPKSRIIQLDMDLSLLNLTLIWLNIAWLTSIQPRSHRLWLYSTQLDSSLPQFGLSWAHLRTN